MRHAFQTVSDPVPGHPAVIAWRALGQPRVTPECIEVLPGHRAATIYRLGGIGPVGTSVIAKRSRTEQASVECMVYEEILPRLPVTSPRYYGFTREDDAYAWLFLEDVGDERYSASNAEHLALAGRWLGMMHGSATCLGESETAARMPDGGPRRYLTHLRATRDSMRRSFSNPALTADDINVLATVMAQLDLVERQWESLEDSCSGIPSTLVHGDFRPKNAHIRNHRTTIALLPIDWETAGWGLPAADLARVDVDAYADVVRDWWPGVDVADVRRLACVGRVFRFLAAIAWDTAYLTYETAALLSQPMASIAVLQVGLADAMRAAGVGA
jgi:phosphotransferase family enzyme